MSFHVVFQCERYKGIMSQVTFAISVGLWLDVRQGLFITTGTFSRHAVKDATRDGVPPIDLVGGINSLTN